MIINGYTHERNTNPLTERESVHYFLSKLYIPNIDVTKGFIPFQGISCSIAYWLNPIFCYILLHKTWFSDERKKAVIFFTTFAHILQLNFQFYDLISILQQLYKRN